MELDGTGSSDPDNDTLAYFWQLLGNLGNLENADTQTPTYFAPDEIPSVENVTVQLTVTDAENATDSDNAMIAVGPVNEPPSASFKYSVVTAPIFPITENNVPENWKVPDFEITENDVEGKGYSPENIVVAGFFLSTSEDKEDTRLELDHERVIQGPDEKWVPSENADGFAAKLYTEGGKYPATLKVTDTDGLSDNVTKQISVPGITSLAVKPSETKLKVGSYENFYAIATYTNGENGYVTAPADWVVEPSRLGNIATISWLSVEPPYCAASFHAENSGEGEVRASYKNHSDNAKVIVKSEKRGGNIPWELIGGTLGVIGIAILAFILYRKK